MDTLRMALLRRLGNRTMSESENITYLQTPPTARNRKSAVLTFLAAILSFIFGLVVFLSNAEERGLRENSMVSFNMSTLGQGAIKVYAANATNSVGAGSIGGILGLKRSLLESEGYGMPISLPRDEASVVQVEVREVLPNAVEKQIIRREALPVAAPDPSPAPAIGGLIPTSPAEMDAMLRSAGGAVATMIAPNGALPTASPLDALNKPLDALTKPLEALTKPILNDIEKLLNGVVGNLTLTLGKKLEPLAEQAIQKILSSAGIQQWYGVYLTEYCGGNFVPNYADPNAKLNITACTKYMDLKSSPGKLVNSTFKVGNAIVDVAPLNIVNRVSSSSGYLKTIVGAFIVLNVSSIIFSGLLIVIMPLYLMFAGLRSPRISLFIGIFISSDAISHVLTALLVSVIGIAATAVGNDLLGELGVKANKSNGVLAMLWISALFMMASSISWFVSIFKRTYVRRTLVAEVLSASVDREKPERNALMARGAIDSDEEAVATGPPPVAPAATSFFRRSSSVISGQMSRSPRTRGMI